MAKEDIETDEFVGCMSEPIRMDGQYQTRQGRNSARVLCIDAKGTQPVVALVSVDDCEFVRRFNADGIYDTTGRQSPYDLVPVPKKHKATLHVNGYPDGGWTAYATRKHADGMAHSGRIAYVEIPFEFTEGEGLSPPEGKQ